MPGVVGIKGVKEAYSRVEGNSTAIEDNAEGLRHEVADQCHLNG